MESGVRTTAHGVVVLDVTGALDMHAVAPVLERLADLLRAAHSRLVVVVDLSKVTSIDSHALAALGAACKEAKEIADSVRLVAHEDWVVGVVRIAALSHVVSLHRTLEDALRPWTARRGVNHHRAPRHRVTTPG
jgi:anti-anti-sigma factor